MSTENIQKFVEAVAADPALREKVRMAVEATSGGDPSPALVALAAGQGLEIELEEFRNYDTARAVDELNLDELDAVSGGNYTAKNPKSPFGPP